MAAFSLMIHRRLKPNAHQATRGGDVGPAEPGGVGTGLGVPGLEGNPGQVVGIVKEERLPLQPTDPPGWVSIARFLVVQGLGAQELQYQLQVNQVELAEKLNALREKRVSVKGIIDPKNLIISDVTAIKEWDRSTSQHPSSNMEAPDVPDRAD